MAMFFVACLFPPRPAFGTAEAIRILHRWRRGLEQSIISDMRLRASRLTAIIAGVGLSLTAAVALEPSLRFAYRAPELHIAFDTSESLIALSAAYLVFGRLRERGLLRDALLVVAFLLIGLANLSLLVAPSTVLSSQSQSASVWGSLLVRAMGASAIAVAAWAGHKPVAARWTRGRNLILGAGVSFVSIGVSARLFADTIGTGLAPDISPTQGALITGNAWLLSAQLILVLLFTVAAIGFTLEAEAERSDPFLRWLGPGTALSAIARINFFLFPSIYTDYVYVGDFLRLTFYLMVLFGAAREIRLYWQRLEGDIVERDLLNNELERLSVTDPLTGLSNRRGFESLAEHEVKLAPRLTRTLSLLFIDLNGMKQINDTHGHEAGDDALRQTAEILRGTFRDTDILARLGGDEFCVLAVSEPDEAQRAILRLRQNVASANSRSRQTFDLSLSVGGAFLKPDDSLTLAQLMEEADEQMYKEKLSRKTRPRILLLDDDPDMRLLLRIQLDATCEIDEAGTFREGISKLAAAPDLIVLDHVLPDASGLDFIASARATLGTKVMIVMLTGADLDEAAILRAGADDYLTKPFAVEILQARIERLLARRRVAHR